MFGLRVEDGAIHHTAVSETLTFQQTVGARLSNQQGAPPAAEPDGGTSPIHTGWYWNLKLESLRTIVHKVVQVVQVQLFLLTFSSFHH